MTTRPVVSVYSSGSATEIVGNVPMPAVFTAPIRDDTVQFVHTSMAKNRRQAHGVYFKSGQEHSAESWGTGRAVARIPRIGGSGTSRSGQATFGNMCRKGRMFAPLKTWRKWHKRINVNQKRHAVASALAASAVAPLVLARGHRVMDVPELPLVLDSLNVERTQDLLKTLNKFGAQEDLHRVRKSKTTRCGSGKMRHSRFVMRKGPLVVYGDKNVSVKQTARNLPGVDTCSVHRLNLLQLAPGGHLGRFIVFTQDAFEALDKVFGTYREKGVEKNGYQLNRSMMACADLARIINSDQIQSKLREVRTNVRAHDKNHKNPLKNRALMQRLNPYSKTAIAVAAKLDSKRKADRLAKLKVKRSKTGRQEKVVRAKRFAGLREDLEESFRVAQKFLDDEKKAGEIPVSDEEEESDE